MNVFDLRERLVNDYADYTRSFINIRDEGIRDLVDREVAEGLLWPNPILQLNPAFEPGETIDELAEAGVLDAECRRIFRRDKTNDEPDGKPLRLHRHQAEAIKVARSGANYVLTTGTGSGKSLTYIIPIVDHVLRRGSGKGIRARAVSRPVGRSSLGQSLDGALHDRRRVSDDPERGELEDRSLRIRIHGDDARRFLHTDHMLGGAAEPDCDVDLRPDGFPGLADLHAERCPACVDHGAGRADGSVPDRFRQPLEQ
jgi:hypothetical protein